MGVHTSKEYLAMQQNIDRRQFLTNSGLVASGVAGGLAFPWLFQKQEQLLAQDKPPMHNAEEQLKKLKLELPPVGKPTGLIIPAVRAGDLLFLSGHTPSPVDGKPVVGKLGMDYDVKQGQAAARNVALRVLSIVRGELGTLDKVVRLVKVLGMVNCTGEFKETPAVINGFSSVLIDVFGEQAGKGARSAVGMSSLPGGAPVEIEAIFQVRA